MKQKQALALIQRLSDELFHIINRVSGSEYDRFPAERNESVLAARQFLLEERRRPPRTKKPTMEENIAARQASFFGKKVTLWPASKESRRWAKKYGLVVTLLSHDYDSAEFKVRGRYGKLATFGRQDAVWQERSLR
jgi:hypothetical protein